MSRLVARNQLVDFTSVNTPVFDFGTSLNNGYDYTNQATNNTTKTAIVLFGQVILMEMVS